MLWGKPVRLGTLHRKIPASCYLEQKTGIFIRHAAVLMDCFAVLSFYILQCSDIFFAGADLYDSVNIVYKNLAIADVTGKEYLLCSLQ